MDNNKNTPLKLSDFSKNDLEELYYSLNKRLHPEVCNKIDEEYENREKLKIKVKDKYTYFKFIRNWDFIVIGYILLLVLIKWPFNIDASYFVIPFSVIGFFHLFLFFKSNTILFNYLERNHPNIYSKFHSETFGLYTPKVKAFIYDKDYLDDLDLLLIKINVKKCRTKFVHLIFISVIFFIFFPMIP